jgi:hypothetical protein
MTAFYIIALIFLYFFGIFGTGTILLILLYWIIEGVKGKGKRELYWSVKDKRWREKRER